MKKHILLLTAVCTAFMLKAGDLTVNGHGGGGDSKLTIGISVGAALPMGDYGKKDTVGHTDSTKTSSGYASTGFHFDATAAYMFSDNVGGELMIGGNMNSYDATTFMTANGIKSPGTFTANNYYIGQYLVGPVFSFGGSSFKFNIRVLVGLVTANATVWTETNGQSGGAEFSETYTGNSGSGFGYNIGAGIKYNFNDKMGLLVNVDYLGSSIGYTGYTSSGIEFGTAFPDHKNTTLKYTMALGMVNASVGIAFNL